MTSRGGKRKGAGRPRKSGGGVVRLVPPTSAPAGGVDAPPLEFDSPEDYLLAVVQGKAPADAVRVGAARALLPFTKRRQRVPLAAVRTPMAQQAADEAAYSNDINGRFKRRAAELAAARKKGA